MDDAGTSTRASPGAGPWPNSAPPRPATRSRSWSPPSMPGDALPASDAGTFLGLGGQDVADASVRLEVAWMGARGHSCRSPRTARCRGGRPSAGAVARLLTARTAVTELAAPEMRTGGWTASLGRRPARTIRALAGRAHCSFRAPRIRRNARLHPPRHEDPKPGRHAPRLRHQLRFDSRTLSGQAGIDNVRNTAQTVGFPYVAYGVRDVRGR